HLHELLPVGDDVPGAVLPLVANDLEAEGHPGHRTLGDGLTDGLGMLEHPGLYPESVLVLLDRLELADREVAEPAVVPVVELEHRGALLEGLPEGTAC